MDVYHVKSRKIIFKISGKMTIRITFSTPDDELSLYYSEKRTIHMPTKPEKCSIINVSHVYMYIYGINITAATHNTSVYGNKMSTVT